MVIFIEDLPGASSTEGLRWTKLSVDIHFLVLAMKCLTMEWIFSRAPETSFGWPCGLLVTRASSGHRNAIHHHHKWHLLLGFLHKQALECGGVHVSFCGGHPAGAGLEKILSWQALAQNLIHREFLDKIETPIYWLCAPWNCIGPLLGMILKGHLEEEHSDIIWPSSFIPRPQQKCMCIFIKRWIQESPHWRYL